MPALLRLIAICTLSLGALACSSNTAVPPGSDAGTQTSTQAGSPATRANVTAVQASGNAGSYTFSVTLSSPDTGCTQYANWWEVLSEDGELLHRRILAHSHVDEQPFTRSSSPVAIQAADRVVVRGHMFPGGYGGEAMVGSVNEGFTKATLLAPDFASQLASVPPQPSGCAF